MAISDFTGKNIQDTYQRVVQTDGTNLADGTGSAITTFNVTSSHAISASYALSASHEITYELSSSHAETADALTPGIDIDVRHVTASGNISASGTIHASIYKINGILFANEDNNNLLIGSSVSNPITLGRAGTTPINLLGAVTASGNISASGTVTTEHIYIPTGGVIEFPDASFPQYLVSEGAEILKISGSQNFKFDTKDGHLAIKAEPHKTNVSGMTVGGLISGSSGIDLKGDITTTGHITASGNISASGNIIAVSASIQHLDGPEGGGISFASGNPTLKGEDGAQISLTDDTTISGGNNRLIVNEILNVNTTHITASGILNVSNTTDASEYSGASGAIRTTGGASIAKKLWVGHNLLVDDDIAVGGVAFLGTLISTGIISGSSLSVTSHITASGNISSSGEIIGTINGGTF